MPSIKLLSAMLLFASTLAVPVKEVLDIAVEDCATCEKVRVIASSRQRVTDCWSAV
jgi:hypothetical protein